MERSFALDLLEPPAFLKNNHVQTIFSTIFPPVNNLRKTYKFEDIILPTSDKTGDSLWIDHNPPLASYDKNAVPYNGYYLILLHGMEGTSDSPYIVSMAEKALLSGYGVVRVNQRSCGRGENLATRCYNAGMTDDIELVENYVYKTLSKNIVLCGFSLSANLVLKYLGENKKTKASLFSAVSPPLDLRKACEFIDSPKGILYRKVFLDSFKEKYKKGIFTASPEIVANAMKVKTMFDFDDLVTSQIFGFKSALDYYKHSSSMYYIPNITTKGILIHAEDDPLVPPDAFKNIPWKKYKNITTLLPAEGGHVGFLTKKTKLIPDGRWLNFVLFEYFKRQLKTGKKEAGK